MAQLFNIQDDKVVINKLALRYLEGSVIHAGSFDIVGNASVQNNLNATSITVDTLTVKNLITDKTANAPSEFGQWAVNTEEELVGKGLEWAWGSGSVKLMYRNGGRIWIDSDLDLPASKSYKIDDTEVLSLNALGPQVTKSKLKELGTLRSLSVTGDSLLSEFAFFNSGLARLGLNTDQPNGTFSVVENDVEVIVGSSNYGTAVVGTFTNHNLSIITDNTPRVTFKNSGEVVFGGELTKSANVIINGTLTVDSIVSDTRIERYSPLEFKTARNQSIAGLGLIWNGGGIKRFVMLEDPNRLFSSESIDLADGKAYLVNGKPVLSETTLGRSVTDSSLTTIGALKSLTVSGNSELLGHATINTVKSNSILIDDNTQRLDVFATGINADTNLLITIAQDEVYYADHQEIIIGNNQNTRRPVKLFGPVSIGITNPDLDVSFAVNGPVQLNNKKFISSNTEPTAGSFNKGDICWNTDPCDGNYVGWVCVTAGAPGIWAPFGAIGR